MFSSWWVNFPPLITATQVQQANSRSKGITLIAANSGESWYNSGSGIYVNGEPLISYYNVGFSAVNKLLVSSVVRETYIEKFPRDFSFMYSDFAPNVIEFMPYVHSTGSLQISYSDLICKASYSVR